ncbi:glutathione S-transferase [Nitzschia inconspicua]|uniref:Glutathione S-transferase n=1 Tax=Nitzschia inconspicua TaxID=303405 RepID=A0A9K3Q7H2_9STRA|nr:glutathione S-transferase [Nitzschia inconspicua]
MSLPTTKSSRGATTGSSRNEDDGADGSDVMLVHDMKQMGMRHLQRPPLNVVMAIYDMFNKIEKRDPPSNTKTIHLRLITIRVSHYNEKARWALDLLEDDDSTDSPYYYTEDCHPAGFQAFESIRASKGHASATPMVIDGETDQVYIKSDSILRHYCPNLLYPTPYKSDIEQFEDDLGDRLGPAVRTYAYGYLLTKEYFPALVPMNTGPECSVIENFLFPYMRTMIGPTLQKSLQINDASVQLSKDTIQSVFGDVEKRLKNGKQQYLFGDTFTAADLTFAALASPLLRPPELQAFQAPLSQLPPDMIDFVKTLQSSPAGQHALRMYRFHRLGGPGPSNGRIVQIKSAPRNRIPWMAAMGVVAACTAVTVAARKLVA